MTNRIRVAVALVAALSLPARGSDPAAGETDESPHRLSLAECIDAALENSRQRSVSQLAVEIAEAQHRQALSARWPQAVLTSALTRRPDRIRSSARRPPTCHGRITQAAGGNTPRQISGAANIAVSVATM